MLFVWPTFPRSLPLPTLGTHVRKKHSLPNGLDTVSKSQTVPIRSREDGRGRESEIFSLIRKGEICKSMGMWDQVLGKDNRVTSDRVGHHLC